MGDGKPPLLSLKPDNVALPARTAVRLATGTATERMSGLDGKRAVVESVDYATGRYILRGPGGKQLRLRCCQVIA